SPARARPCGFWCSGRRESGPMPGREWPDLQPPFCTGSVLMGADDGGIDNQGLKVRVVGHRREDAPPDTLMAPTAEAAEDAVPVAEQLGQVAPGRARPHDPQPSLDEHAVVAARRAARALVTDDVRQNPLP